MLRSAYPPGGDPLDSLIPQALVVVDSRQGGPPNFETEIATGSAPIAKTIAMVVVAALAALSPAVGVYSRVDL